MSSSDIKAKLSEIMEEHDDYQLIYKNTNKPVPSNVAQKIIMEKGFVFLYKNGNSIILDRDTMFLEAIKKYRQQNNTNIPTEHKVVRNEKGLFVHIADHVLRGETKKGVIVFYIPFDRDNPGIE